MATYAEVAEARKIVDRVRGQNNTAREVIMNIGSMRASLASLAAAERQGVIDAITDLGYDAGEIQAILNAWQAVQDAMGAAGITEIP